MQNKLVTTPLLLHGRKDRFRKVCITTRALPQRSCSMSPSDSSVWPTSLNTDGAMATSSGLKCTHSFLNHYIFPTLVLMWCVSHEFRASLQKHRKKNVIAKICKNITAFCCTFASFCRLHPDEDCSLVDGMRPRHIILIHDEQFSCVSPKPVIVNVSLEWT